MQFSVKNPFLRVLGVREAVCSIRWGPLWEMCLGSAKVHRNLTPRCLPTTGPLRRCLSVQLPLLRFVFPFGLGRTDVTYNQLYYVPDALLHTFLALSLTPQQSHCHYPHDYRQGAREVIARGLQSELDRISNCSDSVCGLLTAMMIIDHTVEYLLCVR